MAAMSVGYTSAVPTPKTTAAPAARAAENDGRGGVDDHPRHDERLSPDAVGPVAGANLPEAPHRRVQAGNQPHLSGACSVRDQEQGDDAPGKRVVEVVDQPRLRTGAQCRLAVGGVGE